MCQQKDRNRLARILPCAAPSELAHIVLWAPAGVSLRMLLTGLSGAICSVSMTLS